MSATREEQSVPGSQVAANGAVQPSPRTPLAVLRRIVQNKAVLPIVSVIVFLILWQAFGSTVNPILLATPTAVGNAFVEITKDGSLGPAFLHAMAVLASGFALAAVVGIGLGILMGRSEAAHRVLNPYVSFFQATPLIALTPLVVIWFGIDFQAEVSITFLLAVWSIIINTEEGIRNTPQNLLDMARIYQASTWSVIRNIAIPFAIPYIFAGLRIGIAKGLVGVIIGEMDISLKGLGGLIQNYGDAFQTAELMAAIISSSLVGVLGTVVLEIIRRRIAPWAEHVNVKGRA